MRLKSPVARRSAALAASVSMTLAIGFGTTVIPRAGAAPHPDRATEGSGQAKTTAVAAADKGYYDARSGATSAAKAALDLRAAVASSRPAAHRLRASLGRQAVVEMDGLTGTPRQVARLDGFLTGRSSQPASKVALGYVRSHLAALGMKRSDLRTLDFRRDYVDVAGIHHLSWTQSVGGVEVFGNGLQGTVTRDGRLLSLGGSPVSGLKLPAATASKITSHAAAIAAARADVGEVSTAAGRQDYAQRVLFVTPDGVRRAWQAITMSAARPMLTVVDAADGRVLYRRDLSSDTHGAPTVRTPVTWKVPQVASRPDLRSRAKAVHSTGLAFEYFPKHIPGGIAHSVDFTRRGWLSRNANVLAGNNAHAYSDVNDDDRPNKSEEVKANTPHHWTYRLKPFHLKRVSFCDNPYPCSWNPNKPFSWQTNRAQNTTQVFYFVNNWHDHLMRRPIGFTEAAGNFQKVNSTNKGAGHDAVQTQTDDGANTDNGLPDGNHIDNANMATPPDGHRPRMQMFLQHAPFTHYPKANGNCADPCDEFSPTNVGDEADTVYHEYTHGLSNRLVVDAAGRSTLGGVQAGSMGEGWSDWYAMDYLVAQGLQKDRDTVDIVMFQYDGFGVFLDRTEPMDCKVDKPSPIRCTGGETGHTGGYTYDDYGDVIGFPEVHSDGEIWAQTLWDLRDELRSKRSESLVTRAMSIAPANPSFLDMRNAILLADLATTGGDNQDAIWAVFADRGMGYFAGSLGGDDAEPGASFELPPTGNDTGTIVGTVTDSQTANPIEGAVVTVAFQGSPFITNPSTTTAADGTYSIGPVPQGTYPKVTISAPGYDQVNAPVTVDQPQTTNDAALDRDWASASGGADISDFTGPDFTNFGCGPDGMIDQSTAFGWGSVSDLDADGEVTADTPKQVTVELPVAVDISEITVLPTATCGDGTSASAGSYRIEVSTDGATFNEVASDDLTFAEVGDVQSPTLTGSTDAIEFVRYWIDAPLVVVDTVQYGTDPCPSGGFSGCDFEDSVELEVYGAPSP